jgi:hypothetical protein
MARRVRVTLDMDASVWDDVEAFATRIGWDSVEFVRNALGTERFLIEQEEAGATLMLLARNAAPLQLSIGPRLPEGFIFQRSSEEPPRFQDSSDDEPRFHPPDNA